MTVTTIVVFHDMATFEAYALSVSETRGVPRSP
jgi:hypothetical protein